MTDERHKLESLGGDVTRGGVLPRKADGMQSLGEQDTGGDVVGGSTASDLRDLADDWDNEQPDLESLESRYEIGEPLGRGGMGDVRRAVDRRLNRPVAIKRIRGEFVKSRRAAERFLAEARAVAALNHFNIVQIYDFGRDAEGHFIAMELVEGRSLAGHLAAAGALPTDAAVEIVSQLCDALSLAHSRGVIHRDIKPANILLAGSGRVAGAGSAAKFVPKLTDFGLARFEGGDGGGHTQTGAVLGTIDYMPPEQRRDATQVDARSDLWSLAATLYEMLTGESPAIIRVDRVPDSIRDVLLKALETDPDQRYATADEFRDALFDARSAAQTAAGNACRSCGHVNTPDATFCLHCGKAVHDVCLSCDQPLDHKAEFCGKCGANVRQDLERHAQKLQAERKNVTRLQNEFQHHNALERLDLFTEKRHAALGKFVEWAKHTRGSIQQEIEELERSREHLLATARARAADRDADGVVRTLDMVPEPFRNDAVLTLLQDAQDQLTEIKRLRATIRKGLDAKAFDKVLPYLERLVELEPSDAQARQLRNKLRQRFPELAGKKKSLAPERKPKQQAAAPVILEEISEPAPAAAAARRKQPPAIAPVTPDVANEASSAVEAAGNSAQVAAAAVVTKAPSAEEAADRVPDQNPDPSTPAQHTGPGAAATSLSTAAEAGPAAVVAVERAGAWWTRRPERWWVGPSACSALLIGAIIVLMNSGWGSSPGENEASSGNDEAARTPLGDNLAGSADRPLANGVDTKTVIVLTEPFADFRAIRATTASPARAFFSRNGDRLLLSYPTLGTQCWQIDPQVTFLSEFGAGANSVQTEESESDFSPDGRRIATATWDNTTSKFDIWDASTGQRLVTMNKQVTMRDPKFLADGERIMGTFPMGRLGHFALNSRAAIINPMSPGSFDRLVAVSPDGKSIAFVRGNREIVLAPFPGSQPRWSSNFPLQRPEAGEWVHAVRYAIAFSADSSRLAAALYRGVGSGESSLTIWEVATGRVRQQWKDIGEPVTAVQFSVNGQQLVTGGDFVRIWDVTTGKPLYTFRCGRRAGIIGLGATGDGKAHLAVNRSGRLFRIPADAEQIENIPRQKSTGSLTRGIPNDGAVQINPHTIEIPGTSSGREIGIAYFSADGERVVLGRSYSIAAWQLKPSVKRLSVIRDRQSVLELKHLSPDGKFCAATRRTTRSARFVTVYSMESGRKIATGIWKTSNVGSTAFLPDGKSLLTCADGGSVLRWSTADPQMRPIATDTVNGKIGVSADGKFFALRGAERFLVGRYPNGTAVWQKQILRRSGTSAMALSKDGGRFAVVSSMRNGTALSVTLSVWDTATGNLVQQWTGFRFGQGRLQFMNGGRSLVRAGKRVQVWDVDSGRERLSRSVSSDVRDVAVGLWASQDGRTLKLVTKMGRLETIDLAKAKSEPADGPAPVATIRPDSKTPKQSNNQ